jgi:hypothetical protein
MVGRYLLTPLPQDRSVFVNAAHYDWGSIAVWRVFWLRK